MQLDISTRTQTGTPIGVTINASAPVNLFTTVNHVAAKAIRHGMAPGSVRVVVRVVGTSKSVTVPIGNDFTRVCKLVDQAWALLGLQGA